MRRFTMRRVRISLLAAALISIASAPASADVIHWHLPGVIDGSLDCDPTNPEDCQRVAEVNAYLLQFFPVGTQVDFDLAIDTHDFCSSPNVGGYEIKEFDVTINGVTSSSGPGAGVLEKPDNLGCAFDDPIGDTHVRAFGDSGPFGDVFGDFTVEMFFGLSPGGDLLPTEVPSGGGFFLERQPFERDLGGQLGPASIVPEPATALLVLGGLAAATAVRRRRR
jgi:PEP-CTERM motif